MSATESDQLQNAAPADTKENGMTAKNPAKRRKTLLIVLLIFIAAGVIWLLLWLLVFSTRETTDDAYVGGNQVAISAQVPGTVVAILADDTQHVEAGQILVKLDNTDASVRLAQAEASLASAVRQVRQQTDSASGSDAAVAERAVDLKKAEADLKRRLPLVAQQAEAPETIQHLRDAVAQARDHKDKFSGLDPLRPDATGKDADRRMPKKVINRLPNRGVAEAEAIAE